MMTMVSDAQVLLLAEVLTGAGLAKLLTGEPAPQRPEQIHGIQVPSAEPGWAVLLRRSRPVAVVHGLVEVALGDGPRFRALGAQVCGGVVQVNPPRRFEAAGRFTVWVGEEAIAFGPGAFPLGRGSYVIALGAAPQWGELALVDGVLRDTSGGAVVQPHLVLDLERGGLATV